MGINIDHQLKISARVAAATEIYFSIIREVKDKYKKEIGSTTIATLLVEDRKIIVGIADVLFQSAVKYADVTKMVNKVVSPSVGEEFKVIPDEHAGSESSSKQVDIGDY